MGGQVVVHDQHVAPCPHPFLGQRAAGKRGEVFETGRGLGFRDDNAGNVEHTGLPWFRPASRSAPWSAWHPATASSASCNAILHAHLAGDFAVICAGRIEQQQGVAGRRRVHHNKLLAGLTYDAGNSLEDGNLLGTGRAKVFFQKRPALGMRIDTADRQMLKTAGQGLRQMRGRIGGGQMHRQRHRIKQLKAPVLQQGR